MWETLWPWVAFNAFVLAMLALDLGVFHKDAHTVKVKEALMWTGIWIFLALLFNVGIYFWHGKEAALQFLAGYVIEKSLSVDNIFVFLIIFSHFHVPAKHQHKILFWGILGALIMRALFITIGITLIHKFHWMIYVFGAFLIFTGLKMAFEKDKHIEIEKNILLRFFRKIMPVAGDCSTGKFFITDGVKRYATPLFVVLIVVETTDIIFAVDSIPAVLAVTHDPFIVYTSNVFAILGLRALYFALSGVMTMFHFLHYGLSFVLAFVGVKMVISGHYKIPIGVSLSVIVGALALSVIASLIWPAKEKDHPAL